MDVLVNQIPLYQSVLEMSYKWPHYKKVDPVSLRTTFRRSSMGQRHTFRFEKENAFLTILSIVNPIQLE